jgi:hypothetical protein
LALIFRRSAAPLLAAVLILLIVGAAVWLVLLTGDNGSASTLPVIQIGSAAESHGETGTTGAANSTLPTGSADATTATSGQESTNHSNVTQGSSHNSGLGGGQVEPGQTTVVSSPVRVQAGGHGSSSTQSTAGTETTRESAGSTQGYGR